MKIQSLVRSISGRSVLWVSVVLAVVSLLSLAFVVAAPQGGCHHVQGRLVDGSRFIGTIEGDYVIHQVEVFEQCPFGSQVSCTGASSTVTGNRGTIDFVEYGVVDFNELQGTNGAVLILVQGGTGSWEGATGHIVLSGYFHYDTGSSNWDYQGEVCTP